MIQQCPGISQRLHIGSSTEPYSTRMSQLEMLRHPTPTVQKDQRAATAGRNSSHRHRPSIAIYGTLVRPVRWINSMHSAMAQQRFRNIESSNLLVVAVPSCFLEEASRLSKGSRICKCQYQFTGNHSIIIIISQ